MFHYSLKGFRKYGMSLRSDLFFGDCHDLIKTLPDHSIDLILTDPPYGTTVAKWDKTLDFAALWPEYERVLKPTGVCAIFSAQPFTSMLIASNPGYYRNLWYWKRTNKTGHLLTRRQPLRVIEEICIFGRTPLSATYNPQMVALDRPVTKNQYRPAGKLYKPTPHARLERGAGAMKTYTHEHPTHLLEFAAVPSRSQLVPTQKPVDLLQYLIRTYSHPGEVILDPTMGAGSTGVAARAEGRHFIGFERDDAHFEIAQNRLRAA